MNASAPARLSIREIEQHIACITTQLNQLAAGDGDMQRFAEVGERFCLLRAAYQAQPATVEPHVARLAQLSRQFDGLLDIHLARVVDRYQEVNERIRAAEREKEFLREYFIRKAGQGHVSLAGQRAEVLVRSIPTRVLPPASTDARVQLDRLVLDSGHWQEVSQLSRAKLQHALDETRFGPQQQAIAALCPVTVSHQVTSRLRGA